MEHASHAYGSFTERGLKNIAMQSGTNVRIFNDVTLPVQDFIKYDETTGYLTLAPGTYRLDGWSLTTFGWDLTPAQQAATYSAPGYAFLWNVDEKKMQALGSLQDPMYSIPSNVHAVVEVSKPTRFYLAHQNGNKVAFISMQLFDPSIKLPDGSVSTSHAFAHCKTVGPTLENRKRELIRLQGVF
jgi:hypothetical protein